MGSCRSLDPSYRVYYWDHPGEQAEMVAYENKYCRILFEDDIVEIAFNFGRIFRDRGPLKHLNPGQLFRGLQWMIRTPSTLGGTPSGDRCLWNQMREELDA